MARKPKTIKRIIEFKEVMVTDSEGNQEFMYQMADGHIVTLERLLDNGDIVPPETKTIDEPLPFVQVPERLENYYNTKFLLLNYPENYDDFTSNKIYEVKDRYVIDEKSHKRGPFFNFADVQRFFEYSDLPFRNKYIEVIEIKE